MNEINMLDSSAPEMIGVANISESVELHLKNSNGENTMSPEDMKLCIVTLKIALDRQMELNHSIILRLAQLEAVKPKRRFWER